MAERYMRAYYYTFTPTGVDEIDAILEAVARAGKAYHHTEDWCEPDGNGVPGAPSYWDKIQIAADEAAAIRRSSREVSSQ